MLVFETRTAAYSPDARSSSDAAVDDWGGAARVETQSPTSAIQSKAASAEAAKQTVGSKFDLELSDWSPLWWEISRGQLLSPLEWEIGVRSIVGAWDLVGSFLPLRVPDDNSMR